MNIVLFAHPDFLGHQSMPRFARMLGEGMKARGHKVEIWAPKARFFRLPLISGLKKWMGYIDQYISFPGEVNTLLRSCPSDTLFVFTDQALGPWVPLVKKRPHVIHCHDFLAQRSAKGEIAENPTKWTGRLYQAYIRHGYNKGKSFISVSQQSRNDLHHFLSAAPKLSEVVYNGLNQAIHPCNTVEARTLFSKKLGLDLHQGFLLHVGGNQWYKNRAGVILMYNALRSRGNIGLPLLLVGEKPEEKLIQLLNGSPFKKDIFFQSGLGDSLVRMAYAGASVFLFPSLAEGFGWPIAEAMASGCPVITTNEAPMTEVAGEAGFYIPRKPVLPQEEHQWANEAAKVIEHVLCLSEENRQSVVEAGIKNAERFKTDHALDKIEEIYQKVLAADLLN